MIELPEYILTCINSLNAKGYEAYVVGGSIRDAFMNLPVHDYDLTTSATPEEMKNVFKHEKMFDTGIKHGTLTVLIKSHNIEITTYRTETTYHDHRHPDGVNYTHSLKEDCKRRDFTINAICYHPVEGIIDYFDGQQDIANKIIRCIGNPDDRFDEDALRILRALRFSCALEFTIEPNTGKAILNNRKLLDFVSQERISEEFQKILLSPTCHQQILDYYLVFSQIIPELDSLDKTYIDELIKLLSLSPVSFSTRFALILYMIGKANNQNPAILGRIILNRMKYSNLQIDKTIFLLSNYENPLNAKDLIKYQLSNYEEGFMNLLSFKKILEPDFDKELAIKYYTEIKKNNEPYLLSQLAINGKHVQQLGYQNSEIAVILKKCLHAVIEEQVPNTVNDLVNYIKK